MWIAIIDSDGKLVKSQTGTTLEKLLATMDNPGEYTAVEITDEDHAALIQARDEASKTPLQACYDARRAAYGPINDQLDEIFHDADAWRERIGGIKEQYPKP